MDIISYCQTPSLRGDVLQAIVGGGECQSGVINHAPTRFFFSLSFSEKHIKIKGSGGALRPLRPLRLKNGGGREKSFIPLDFMLKNHRMKI
ncbi:hypothetical protein KAW48_00120 [candidate division WOR-3 bacterium]|nr:hypothetical protein [candidate division WOR-3 bacterium]